MIFNVLVLQGAREALKRLRNTPNIEVNIICFEIGRIQKETNALAQFKLLTDQ